MKDKFRYWFDNLMSQGTVALIEILLVATGIIVIFSGILISIIDYSTGTDIVVNLWKTLLHTMDPGTLAEYEGHPANAAILFLVTLFGIFITSLLIGIISSGIEDKLSTLRKGHSLVLEEGHVVILGFDEGIYTILSELITANANKKRAAVVVMSSMYNKQEMEDMIRARIKDFKTTKIICRSGNIADVNSIKICAIDKCRSIIVNSQTDARAIKAIMATTSILKSSGNENAYIVTVIREDENLEAAKIAGGKYLEILHLRDILARIVVHTSRNKGLAKVYTEILNYKGHEFYVKNMPELVGKRVKDLNLYLPVSMFTGIIKDGEPIINPDKEYVIEKDDRIILFAEDDDSSYVSERPGKYNKECFNRNVAVNEQRVKKILVLGNSNKLRKIIIEQDKFFANGSMVTVAVTQDQREDIEELKDLELNNIKIEFEVVNIYKRAALEKMLKRQYDLIFVLAEKAYNLTSDEKEMMDSKRILLLLQLQNIKRKNNYTYVVTSEMHLTENHDLAQGVDVQDFVISTNISNLVVSQIALTRELRKIFKILFSKEGSEIYMRPARQYVVTGRRVDMYTASMSVTIKNEVFLGYKRYLEDGSFEIIRNPAKTKEVVFGERDSFIVLSEK